MTLQDHCTTCGTRLIMLIVNMWPDTRWRDVPLFCPNCDDALKETPDV